MNKTFAASILISGILAGGCAAQEDENAMDRYGNKDNNQGALNGNAMDNYQSPAERDGDGDMTDQLGYVRYDKSQVDPQGDYSTSVNREETADMITKMILTMDEITNAGTLVTDDEVLIAYDKTEEVDRNQAADMVKKTALSLVPRYYEVYVSDQEQSFGDIQSLSNSSINDENYDNVLENAIKRMRQAPQGEKTYNDETKSKTDPRDSKNGMMGR
ncbi:Sporulation lipoprotein YhcN/YlaJ (Spore_YhcN_YlaJ) [Thalassobacillus cyri]|uniref:Sporulation lipoprotein YhcN/YlaJ (Spore_YhcN_YlaJ) n=1 Tax=Thalassobacillus cyri TaxID=571932 RepID=A0A1H4GER1_9BACI|nr:YhcN/YlaJ family sporulation lipoprotein [Thalassobacillus cyri]SEB07977.1 Sporulation lipoprotein YhcN/YlaJ (Spore_YhcN_YlaJ) [Thalassobacillus cyri]